MTDLPAPLTPADCDLSDFDRMPLDIKRLGGSKFDAGLDDSAWRAGLNLWMSSWHQRPAGSLDDDEEALCTAAGLRDLKKWGKVKAKAMREHWVKCSDGRLYHSTLCELALEAWLEKLSQRKSSGAGNAKRWGAKFDPEQVQADIDIACEHLERLNPDSKALAKARRKHTKRIPDGNPDGTNSPPQSQSQRDKTPRGEKSQENGMEGNGREGSQTQPPPPEPEAVGGPAAPTLTQAEWFSRVDGLVAILPGINRTTGGLANIAPLRSLVEPTDPTEKPCDWLLDVVPAARAAAAVCESTGGLRSWTHPVIANTAKSNRDARLNGGKPHDRPAQSSRSGHTPSAIDRARLRRENHPDGQSGDGDSDAADAAQRGEGAAAHH